MNEVLANKLVAISGRCSNEHDRETIIAATTALRAYAPRASNRSTKAAASQLKQAIADIDISAMNAAKWRIQKVIDSIERNKPYCVGCANDWDISADGTTHDSGSSIVECTAWPHDGAPECPCGGWDCSALPGGSMQGCPYPVATTGLTHFVPRIEENADAAAQAPEASVLENGTSEASTRTSSSTENRRPDSDQFKEAIEEIRAASRAAGYSILTDQITKILDSLDAPVGLPRSAAIAAAPTTSPEPEAVREARKVAKQWADFISDDMPPEVLGPTRKQMGDALLTFAALSAPVAGDGDAVKALKMAQSFMEPFVGIKTDKIKKAIAAALARQERGTHG